MVWCANLLCLKKNQNAPRPSKHPPVRGIVLFCRGYMELKMELK